jgi:hypothetical protein
VTVRRLTLQTKLLLSILGPAAFLLVTLGVVAVARVSAMTRDRVNGEALDLARLKAAEIASFFAVRGRIVTTMVSVPTLRAWWAGYDQFRKPLAGDQNYLEVLALLGSVRASDPKVLEAFFATEATNEYFKTDGRIERENYFVKERWWWREALAEDRLYVSPPGVDASTGAVSVTLQDRKSVV